MEKLVHFQALNTVEKTLYPNLSDTDRHDGAEEGLQVSVDIAAMKHLAAVLLVRVKTRLMELVAVNVTVFGDFRENRKVLIGNGVVQNVLDLFRGEIATT